MGQRKNEFYKFALVAAYNNFAAVQADDGTDNVKTKPYAVLVKSAGTIRLIKAVEDLGDFFLAQTCSAVFHTDIGILYIRGKAEFQIAALIYKLDRVFNQIINHLMYQIWIRIHHQLIMVEPADIEILLLDLRF